MPTTANATYDKASYVKGEKMTVRIPSVTQTSDLTLTGTVTGTVAGAPFTATVPPTIVKDGVSAVVPVQQLLTFTDSSGRKWTLSADGLSFSATA